MRARSTAGKIFNSTSGIGINDTSCSQITESYSEIKFKDPVYISSIGRKSRIHSTIGARKWTRRP